MTPSRCRQNVAPRFPGDFPSRHTSRYYGLRNFRLKHNDAEREELFALLEDTFAELPDLSHFKYCTKPIDITGNNDYRYVTVPDLYGLNDLIEYSVVFFTTNPLHSSSLIGECPWCEQCFPKSRTNQKFCRKKCKNKKTNADKKTREEELITA